MQFILDHAEVRFAVVEDQEQVDKLLHLREQCPRLESIVYDDPRGLRHYPQPFLVSLERLQDLGRKFAVENPSYFEDQIAQGRADDIAVICYTSGTTGSPKGVMLSHRNLIVTGRNAAAQEGLRRDDEVLAYLPMAWVGRPYLLLCAVDPDGLRGELPGERGHGAPRPEGDRAHLFLRAAAHLGEPPDQRDDPHPGRGLGQAEARPVLPRRGAADRAAAAHREAGAAGAAPPVRAGAPPRLRAAEGQPGHAADPPRLHGGRGHRAGDLPVLPRARHQRQAALRHDGVERVHRHPEGRGGEARHGGDADSRRGDPDLRAGGGALQEPGDLSGILQERRRPRGR